MALIAPTIDLFLLSSVVALISWLYITKVAGNLQEGQQNSQSNTQSQTRSLLSVFIALHTIYILYKLVVQSPQNLFTLLHVPLNESSENMRQLLVRKARVAALPSSLEALLAHLQSFDARVAYVRFGHSVVQDCEHCTSFDDFALYALPPPVLEYVRMAAIIGMVTIRNSGRERWRFWALALLTMVAMAELYFVLTGEVTFSPRGKQTIMIHDVALRARRIIFLLLPPLLYLIPPGRPPPSPLQKLPELVMRTEHLRARLQLLRLTSAARARHPSLHESADSWWAEQRADGQCAVNDPKLRDMAQKLGIQLDEESAGSKGLRVRAREVVKALQNGFHPKTYNEAQ